MNRLFRKISFFTFIFAIIVIVVSPILAVNYANKCHEEVIVAQNISQNFKEKAEENAELWKIINQDMNRARKIKQMQIDLDIVVQGPKSQEFNDIIAGLSGDVYEIK